MTVANSSNKVIYVDNAATTKLDDDALALMFDLQKNFEPQEIIFTSGGTESDNWAIKSAVFAHLSERPNIIISAFEHKAILNSCASMEKLGYTVTKLPVDKFGEVNPANLQRKIF